MTYGSICTGIAADAVAWKGLPWRPKFHSEIDPFCCALLKHYYQVPNHGDFTRIGSDAGPIDLLMGGTPCQSFSVAGQRRGLDDDRGNLALEFIELARRLRPRWLVWENVPGVLWSNGGRDFAAFVGGLAQCGYCLAWRVLDAQHFGVPQRRRRVFVAGYLGDWRRPAAVLFERASLCRDTPARRKAREDVAGCLGGVSGERGWCNDLDRSGAFVTHTLPASSSASEDGTGRGTPLVAMTLNAAKGGSGRMDGESETFVVDLGQITSSHNRSRGEAGSPAPTLSQSNAGRQVAVQESQTGIREHETVGTLRSVQSGGSLIRRGMAVRRLTPRECERLMGLPDDYTLVPYRGKLAADDPRYRAVGNSIAVPVLRWIGERIERVERMADR